MNILLKNSIFTAFILTQAEASVQVKTCLLNYTLYHPGTGQCWEGLEQGPCEEAQWVVAARGAAGEAECRARPLTCDVPVLLDSGDVGCLEESFSILTLILWWKHNNQRRRQYKEKTLVGAFSEYCVCTTRCCKTSVKLWKHITETFYGVFLVFLGFYDCQLWAIFHFGTLWA